MSEPTSPDDRAVGPPERLHPLYLLTGLGGSLRQMAGGYAAIGYFAVSGRWSTALMVAVLLFFVMAVGVLLYWRRFEFRVGSSEIRIDSGVLSRTHRSIPFDRVQDVDITQGPLARLLGLARVTFETGGGSALPGKEEGVLKAIRLERAEELRRLVRSRRSRSMPELAAEAHEEEAPPIYRMGPRRLLLAGAFNFSLALFAGLIGLTQTVGDFLGFDPLSRSFWDGILAAGDPIRDYVLHNRAFAAVAGVAVLVLVGVVTGMIRTVVREFGFRLDRTGVGLRRRRGLFTRTDVTVPAKRAQAVIVTSGPLRERLGYCELRLQSLAHDQEGGGSHVLAPLATRGEVDAILPELGWKPLPEAPGWQKVSRSFFWKFVIVLTPLLIPVAVAQAIFAPLVGLAWLILPAILFLARHLEWKRIGYVLDGDRLLVRSGWLKRRVTILPLARIQSIDLRHSVLSRAFGTASLQFGVAGGNALISHSIPDIPSAGARELRDRLLGLRP